MATYNFNLRNPSADGDTPINLVIRWGTRRLVYSTGIAVEPRHWDTDKQVPITTRAHPPGSAMKRALEVFKADAETAYYDARATLRREPSEDELREGLDIATGRKEPVKRAGLLDYFAKFMANAPVTDFSPTYHRRLRQTNDLLRDHLKGRDVPFTALDITFVRGFTKYLTTGRNYNPNSVRNFLKTLRMVVNMAKEEGQDINPAFYSKKLKLPKEDTTTIYLGTDELADLWHMDLATIPRLERVRDLFLLQCWVGLRFSDLVRLSNSNVDGKLIDIRQKKTAQDVVIPLHPMAAAVLSKYDGHPPTMSNQKFNKYLKELLAKVPALQVEKSITRTKGGITTTVDIPKWQLVASHTARRSFATNFYLAGDVPMRTIMAITGHKSEAAFLRYLRLDNEQHAKIMAKSKLFTMPQPVLKAV